MPGTQNDGTLWTMSEWLVYAPEASGLMLLGMLLLLLSLLGVYSDWRVARRERRR